MLTLFMKGVIMSKSAIYTVNSNVTAVAAGGVIPVGSIVRRFGCNIDVSGQGIITKGNGYYKTNATVSFEGTAAGTATIQLYKDGVAVPGALATRTTADGTVYDVTLIAITRNMDCNASVLTVVVSGVAVDVNNLAITVEKE